MPKTPRSIDYDPQQPVDVEFKLLSNDSVMAYGAWLRRSGETKWKRVAKGNMEDTVADVHTLGTVPHGTEIWLRFSLAGTPGGGFKAEGDIMQSGMSVGASGTFWVQGILDEGAEKDGKIVDVFGRFQ